MDISWKDGFKISTAVTGGEVVISANRDGLVSLANILLTLAKEQPGAHIHLDEENSLEDGSCTLVIEHLAST